MVYEVAAAVHEAVRTNRSLDRSLARLRRDLRLDLRLDLRSVASGKRLPRFWRSQTKAVDDRHDGGIDRRGRRRRRTRARLELGLMRLRSHASGMAKGDDDIIAHAGIEQIDADHGFMSGAARRTRQRRRRLVLREQVAQVIRLHNKQLVPGKLRPLDRGPDGANDFADEHALSLPCGGNGGRGGTCQRLGR